VYDACGAHQAGPAIHPPFCGSLPRIASIIQAHVEMNMLAEAFHVPCALKYRFIPPCASVDGYISNVLARSQLCTHLEPHRFCTRAFAFRQTCAAAEGILDFCSYGACRVLAPLKFTFPASFRGLSRQAEPNMMKCRLRCAPIIVRLI
jgi:hypothetical protein